MRSFPHAWVIPGGHTDVGESLEAAAVRELFEETDIQIEERDSNFYYRDKQVSFEPFFGFESSTRNMKVEGEIPYKSHFILYFRVKLPFKFSDIHVKLKPQPDDPSFVEVDALTWVSPDQVTAILSTNPDRANESITAIEVAEDSNQFISDSNLKLGFLYPPYKNEHGQGIGAAVRTVLTGLSSNKID